MLAPYLPRLASQIGRLLPFARHLWEELDNRGDAILRECYGGSGDLLLHRTTLAPTAVIKRSVSAPFLLKNWRRRWLELDSSAVVSWSRRKGAPPAGTLALSARSTVRVEIKRQLGLRIQSGGRELLVQMRNMDEFELWREALQTTITRLSTNATRKVGVPNGGVPCGGQVPEDPFVECLAQWLERKAAQEAVWRPLVTEMSSRALEATPASVAHILDPLHGRGADGDLRWMWSWCIPRGMAHVTLSRCMPPCTLLKCLGVGLCGAREANNSHA